jgi:hypothetical protein
MMGDKPDCPIDSDPKKCGLYVLAAQDIFQILKLPQFRHIRAYISCFEIYGGKLFDLLNDRGLIKCLEDAKQQVQVLGLTAHIVENVAALLELMQRAHGSRSVGATGANSESSRSHLIMQIELRDERSLHEKNAAQQKKASYRQATPVVAKPVSEFKINPCGVPPKNLMALFYYFFLTCCLYRW